MITQHPTHSERWPDVPYGRWLNILMGAPRQTVVAMILVLALFAFEIFNFDTTKFALYDLLGEVNFWGMGWSAILAFAFCAIDFAGLVRIFTPQTGRDEPRELWYLMGAWLLGATMNAMMTWYAVALTLVHRPAGATEVLTPDQLELIVPIFVAVLVWLTRILFIGSLSMAGEQLLQMESSNRPRPRPVAGATPVVTPSTPQPPVTKAPATPPVRPVRPPENGVSPTVKSAQAPAKPGRGRKRPTGADAPQTLQPTPLRAKSSM